MTPDQAARYVVAELGLEAPLVVFDLETTGLSRERDRIVQIAYLSCDPDGTVERRNLAVNPRIPISYHARQIHGISDRMVAGEPGFRRFARAAHRRFDGAAVVCGFNVKAFDVPFLAAELARCGHPLDVSRLVVVDVMSIFHAHEIQIHPRKLEDALAFYCGDPHVGAHDAGADVDATVRVLAAELKRYPIPRDARRLALTKARKRSPTAKPVAVAGDSERK